MRLVFLVASWLGLWIATASAQTCNVIDDYRQAEAAYGHKNFASALAGFRALAEQGLGPAQLRLGQMLVAGEGAAADKAEAGRWIALAAEVGTPGAKDALASLGAAAAKPVGWQPKLGPCVADTAALVNHVIKADSAAGPETDRLTWLARALDSVRKKSPSHLIYLKALYGVSFAGRGPLVIVDARENLPLIVVNETIATTSTSDGGKDLIGAAVFAVHKQLVPTVTPLEVQNYKGRTIRFQSNEDGRDFLIAIKAAIDMAEGLPSELAKLATQLTDLRYVPREPYDKRGGAAALGTYRHDPATGRPYMDYASMYRLQGPSRLVINLVDGGVRLRHEGDWVEAKRQLEEARKRNASGDIARAEKKVKEAVRWRGDDDFDLHEQGNCELEDYELKTMEALKLDPIEINRRYKLRTRRNCA